MFSKYQAKTATAGWKAAARAREKNRPNGEGSWKPNGSADI
jgi:hypothetical protein